ncbi:MAG: histidinol dehydrogenase [Bacteroidales bacterium]|nr:histidinol dehydrogenase [Bacteroidales bacterium]
MNTIHYPEKSAWQELCARPVSKNNFVNAIVSDIIARVKNEGDRALFHYAELFDKITLDSLKVTDAEISAGRAKVPDELKKAISVAKANIEKFHSQQLIRKGTPIETSAGVRCWSKSVPIEKVGLYIPGGSASLFSTVLMLGTPARIAGCNEVVMCTPADKNGNIDPAVLYTADLVGITNIFKVGGAQAIAAMAFGTQTIPKIMKIFGPGNQYVTKAKELIIQEGVAIDMPAGPSEALIIADSEANPQFIAADLLSQAEHGADSQVIMLTDSASLTKDVSSAIKMQLEKLPRKDIASKAMECSMMIVMKSLEECMEFSNMYAPEHLIINTANHARLSQRVVNAGSVFLGGYSCESAGDYASGTNHTLPTNGFAKNYSGISVGSFCKTISFQEITPGGLLDIGPTIEIMAEAENLTAHKNAISIRLKTLAENRKPLP